MKAETAPTIAVDDEGVLISQDEDELELSVVMPCLDEAATVGVCIEKALQAMRDAGIRGEVIIADNGSSDGSPGIARAAARAFVHVKERGYGAALLAGFKAARGVYVVMGDADDSYNFLHIPRFVSELRDGNDLVMGNRFQGGIEPGAMPKLHRYLGNPVLSRVGQLFFKSPCGDFHCGLRGFRREAILDLDLQTPGMEFASEIVVKATLFRLRITEIPTTLSPDGRDRPPHLRSWRDGWRHLRFMSLFCPRWLFFYPGLVLMLAGLVLLALLVPGSRRVGPLTLDIHTLLYGAAFVLIGFQAVVYFVLSNALATKTGLLPSNSRINRLYEHGAPEAGLIIGLLLVIAGVVTSFIALAIWGGQSFGAIDPRVMVRISVPAVLAMVIGCETIMSCLYLSILRMVRR